MRVLVASFVTIVTFSFSVSAEEFRYKPDDSVLATMTHEQSIELLRQLLGSKSPAPALTSEIGAGRRGFYLDDRGRTISNRSRHIERIDVLDDRLRITFSSGDGAGIDFAYRELPEIQSFNQSAGFLDHGARGVSISNEKTLLISEHTSNEEQNMAAFLRKLADALYVLKQSSQGVSPAQDLQFSEVAAQYRASVGKPVFPEEARRFRVQAEAAVRERRMADAVRLYGEALKVAPWWPEGRFNRSLVLAETNRYGEAIAEMKRYLMLVPEAPNARAAQDKIYEWEAKMPGPR